MSEAWRDWTKLPNGQADGVVMRRAPRERSRFCRPFGIKNLGLYEVAERRWLWLASVRRRLVQRRSPLGCKPRAVVALRGALAPSICPVPWYSDCRERAFSGLARGRFSEEQAEKGNGSAMMQSRF